MFRQILKLPNLDIFLLKNSIFRSIFCSQEILPRLKYVSAGHSHTVQTQLVSREVGVQQIPVLIELDNGHCLIFYPLDGSCCF